MIKTNSLQLDESHKTIITILGKFPSVLNRKFKRTMSFKNRIVQFCVRYVMATFSNMSNSLEYDTPFQSAGVARFTIVYKLHRYFSEVSKEHIWFH